MATTNKKQELYYIQNGYVGNAILWWGVDSKGYTTDITKAGKYTKEEAKISFNAHRMLLGYALMLIIMKRRKNWLLMANI
jgi:hypothetical protein